MSQSTTEKTLQPEHAASETTQQPVKRKRKSSPSHERGIKKNKQEGKASIGSGKRDREASKKESFPPERVIKKGKKQRGRKKSKRTASTLSTTTSKFSTLPADIFDKISEYLPAIDVLRMASTAKAFLNFGHAAKPIDSKPAGQRQADDVRISLEAGSREQLEILINRNYKLTALQQKILLPVNAQATPLQKHLQRTTYAEILSGRISLEQALEQIRRLECSLTVDENLPLMQAWLYGLPHWQASALANGFPWLSLIYYPHDPTVGGFFTAEEMSSEDYTLLHAEIASSLMEGNPYGLSINLDQVKTSNVGALIAELSSPFMLSDGLFAALDRDHCVIAHIILANNPMVMGDEEDDEEDDEEMEAGPGEVRAGLEVQVGDMINEEIEAGANAAPEDDEGRHGFAGMIGRNAVATMRLILGLLTPADRQENILRPQAARASELEMAIITGRLQMAYLLAAGLNQLGPFTPLTAGWDRVVGALYFAADFGRIGIIFPLLDMVDVPHHPEVLLTPMTGGLHNGESVFSITVSSGPIAAVRALLAVLDTALHQAVILTPYNRPWLLQIALISAVIPGRTEMVRFLLTELGAEYHEIMLLRPLTTGRFQGENVFFLAIKQKHIDIVSLLLAGLNDAQRQAAILTPQGPMQESNALSLAVSSGCAEMVRVLLTGLKREHYEAALLTPLARGPNRGKSVLFLAVELLNKEVLRVLLAVLNPAQRQAAILSPQDFGGKRGQSILCIAAERNYGSDIVALLLANSRHQEMMLAPSLIQGMSRGLSLSLGSTRGIVPPSLPRGIDRGPSPLFIAALFGQTEAVRALLTGLSVTERREAILAQQKGYDTPYRGQNALFAAVQGEYRETVEELLSGLDIADRQLVINAPQGPGIAKGKTALSFFTKEYLYLYSVMKEYIAWSTAKAELPLTSSWHQTSPMRFFTRPSEALPSEVVVKVQRSNKEFT